MAHGAIHGVVRGVVHGVDRGDGGLPEPPYVFTDKLAYTTAELVQISWDGSTDPEDWLNPVDPTTGGGGTGAVWMYCNSGNTVAGGAPQASGTRPIGPLAAGTYEVRFLANDGFVVIAKSPLFEVV
jgi:hypothetical protein